MPESVERSHHTRTSPFGPSPDFVKLLGNYQADTRFEYRSLKTALFHIDSLSSMIGLKVNFDPQLTLAASSLYRLFARHLPENYHNATAILLFDNLRDVTGKIQIEDHLIIVTLGKRAHNPYLVDSGLADQPTLMPWLEGKKLVSP